MTKVNAVSKAPPYWKYRKWIRQELHLQRVKDKDYSDERFISDAKQIDARLVGAGYVVPKPTVWRQDRNPSTLQHPMSGLNIELIGQGQLELIGAV